VQNISVFKNGLISMGLWLLSFAGKGVAAIVNAESLSHARLLAAADGFCRASLFDEGYAIDPDLTIMIPEHFIGRKLSRDEVADVLKTLTGGLFSTRKLGTDSWQAACVQPPARPFYLNERTLEAVACPPQYEPDRERQGFQSAIVDVSSGSCAVAINDLTAPLGLSRKPQRARQPIFAYLATAGLFGMAIAGFAIWHAAPETRSPMVVPAPHQSAAVFLPDPPSELRPRDTAPSTDTDTTVPAELGTVREFAREASVDTLKADPDERIITIIDGRNGARQHIRVPVTTTTVSR